MTIREFYGWAVENGLENSKGLKDCPFCGGTAKLFIENDAVFVKCDNCGSNSPSLKNEKDAGEAILEVVFRWNGRAKGSKENDREIDFFNL